MCETEVQQHVTQILWDFNEYDFLMHDTNKQRSQVDNNIVILVVCSLYNFFNLYGRDSNKCYILIA